MRVAITWIFFSTAFILGSCADNRETTVKQYVSELVSSQSKGILNVVSFRKTNGYKGDKSGTYIIEWEMEVRSDKEFWKIRLAKDFYWDNFVTESDLRSAEKTSMNWHSGFWVSEQSPIHFPTAKKFKLTGNATMIDSEKGWVTQSLSVKTSLDLN